MTFNAAQLQAIANGINLEASGIISITSKDQISADAAKGIDLSANETVYISSADQINFDAEGSIVSSIKNSISDTYSTITQTEEAVEVVIGQTNTVGDRVSVLENIVRIDGQGLHVVNTQDVGGELLITSDSVNIVTNGEMESVFAGSYIQFGNYQLRKTADNGLAFKMKED